MEKGEAPKFKKQVGPPIEVVKGVDPKKLGEHYVAVNKVQTGKAYEQLGEKVKTRYETKTLPDGTTEVVIVEDHY